MTTLLTWQRISASYIAHTPFGAYCIIQGTRLASEWGLYFPDSEVPHTVGDLNAAFAEAEVDYVRRRA